MSDELKWCRQFSRVSHLLFYHPCKKIRKKNIKRRQKLIKKAIKIWGYFPIPPEWKTKGVN